ncbi:MAG: hypothetical protein PUD59_03575 [bacterium]|nr:hypothetical protein [bacterium]
MNNDVYENNTYYEDNNQSLDTELYTDGDDKKPKLLFIIIGIVIAIIIMLIIIVACSKINKKSSNNYLNSLTVSNGELSPKFNKETLKYSVATTEEIVTVYCSSENSKSTTSGCNKKIYLNDNCIEHNINVTAQDGKNKTYTLNICKVNSNTPIIKSIDLSTDKYTNEDITININAESEIPLHEKAYSIDGGETWQESNEFTISDNITLNIKVRNEMNGEASQTKEITNIDKTIPVVEIIGSIQNGVETTANVVLSAIVTPSETISGYSYTWYKNDSIIKGANKSSYTATSSGKYRVVVKTGSGNSMTSTIYNVIKKSGGSNSSSNDSTNNSSNKYSLSFNVYSNTNSWTKNPVTLTIKEVKSSKGLANTPYSFDGGKTYQSSNSKQITQNGNVVIVVKDKNGNINTKTVTISNIDNVEPKVKIVEKNGILTAEITNKQLIKSPITYEWVANNNFVKDANNYFYDTKSSAGEYLVYVKTQSGYSVKSDVYKINAMINPTASLSITSSDWTKNDVTLTATVKNGTAKTYTWYKGNEVYSKCTTKTCVIKDSEKATTYGVVVTTSDNKKTNKVTKTVKIDKTIPVVKISGTTVNTELSASVSNESKVYSGISGYKWYDSNNKVVSSSSKYTPTKAGTYYVIATSNSKVSSEKTSVKVTSPSASVSTPIASLSATYSSGKAYNSSVWSSTDVTLNATVKNGNAKTYTWYKGTAKYSACTTKTCVIKDSEKATEYGVVITTKEGKTTKKVTQTIKIDKEKPKVSITGTKVVGNKLTINVSNNLSGVKNYQWFYRKTGETGSYTLISGATGKTYTAAKAGSYYAKVTSNAGIAVSANAVTVTSSDSSSNITASLKASTTSWTSGNVKLTITVNGGTFKSATWYYGNGSKSSCSSSSATCTISVNAADTQYYAKVVTKEGKTITTGKVTVKIDKTPPTVSIKYTCKKVGCTLTGSATAKSGIKSCGWYRDSVSNSILSTSKTYTPKVAAKYIYKCTSNSGLSKNTSVVITGTNSNLTK